MLRSIVFAAFILATLGSQKLMAQDFENGRYSGIAELARMNSYNQYLCPMGAPASFLGFTLRNLKNGKVRIRLDEQRAKIAKLRRNNLVVRYSESFNGRISSKTTLTFKLANRKSDIFNVRQMNKIYDYENGLLACSTESIGVALKEYK